MNEEPNNFNALVGFALMDLDGSVIEVSAHEFMTALLGEGSSFDPAAYGRFAEVQPLLDRLHLAAEPALTRVGLRDEYRRWSRRMPLGWRDLLPATEGAVDLATEVVTPDKRAPGLPEVMGATVFSAWVAVASACARYVENGPGAPMLWEVQTAALQAERLYRWIAEGRFTFLADNLI
ncbi:hypothetical protein AB0M43_23915 [Longispora sp. NPDC051575]|uniref:hypothetical protein n=1 Tax=Longispora sp. NPDC051575 TaxID=3154943 RepID=UPI0034455219